MLPEEAVLVEAAEQTAAGLMAEAARLDTRADRRRRRRIAAAVEDGASRQFLLDLTDQVLRIGPRRRAAQRLHDLVAEHGVPSFAGGLDGLALRAAATLAPLFPSAVMPLVTARLRRELSAVVLPAGPAALARRVRRRRREGIRLNVNLLGEAVLGDAEARHRNHAVVGLLARPEIDYVSVKISSVCAQLDVLAYEDGLARIVERLRPVYVAASRAEPAKFVNLDMEEYRDLHLTIDAFTTLLAEPELCRLDAGIVLQAYLPDSCAALEQIASFARRRHAEHDSSIKVRIVKGANLAMERVEAELRGWPQAPYLSKEEVDANYKRLLRLALAPENLGALRVGVASHNLFDVGYALACRAAVGPSRVEIEMLEGMANPQARAVARRAGGLLLYAPVVQRRDFESAVAYLVRRFDENTAPENFLAKMFGLRPGTPAWEAELARFGRAVAVSTRPAGGPRRTQDRSAGEAPTGSPDAAPPRHSAGGETSGRETPGEQQPFANEPDTDFSVAASRAWLARHLAGWRPEGEAIVPAVVAGSPVSEPLTGVGIDPSAPGGVLYRYVQATADDVEQAVETARAAGSRWSERSLADRREILHAAASVMACRRGRLLAVMAYDAGKTAGESDPEVSEAIDFARYYGDRALDLDRFRDGARFSPHRVVVVAPPWNFPLAIPAGGVLAALAAGSGVILKPAPETVLTAWHLAECCWLAGVPRDVLQFVPTADDEVGRRLVTHQGVDAVILTGAFDTARLFLGWRPDLALHAETSGKNALVVTSAADQDDAIRDLLRSAFSHSGQKCSAASLAIVEAPLYDAGHFAARLADAVSSLRVGPAQDPASQVGPLIRPPSGALLRALTTLGEGERWLVEPRRLDSDGYLWSPGVKQGVAPGSEFHLTECFGPVLGLMRAADLGDAIALQNAPRYGLTGGIHTLDEREVARWLEGVAVGNAYVNRHITGAIVQRQPFGGWKASVIGPGAKAGGPNYVASLGSWSLPGQPDPLAELARASRMWSTMARGEDRSALESERNELRLRALSRCSLRLDAAPSQAAVQLATGIAAQVGVHVDCSAAEPYEAMPAGTTVESAGDYLARLAGSPHRVDRIRLHGAPPELRLGLIDAGFEVDVAPLCTIGELELLRWTREQAVSETLHRHGNIRTRR